MKKILGLTIMLLILTNPYSYADEEHGPPYVGSAEFEKVKSLAGTWKGMHAMEGKEPIEMTVDYSVTSNGSAVVEKLFSGTPHEMISVYHDKNGKLSMTHYCGLGNRPEMSLMPSTNPNEIKLDFSGPSDIDPAKDMHMHGLTLIIDGDNLKHDWSYYKDGMEQAGTIIDLSRVR